MREFDIPLAYHKVPSSGIDSFGIQWVYNKHGFRSKEFNEIDHSQNKILCFGDSHTIGAGNQQEDIWPEIIKDKINIPQMFNLAQAGCSSDYILRIFKNCIEYFRPNFVFILWPDHSRFEYNSNGVYYQSLPTSENRIYFMEKATDEWLMNNFLNVTSSIKNISKQYKIPLFDMTLYELIPLIDHADKWPLAVNQTHFNRTWHETVASQFQIKFNNYVKS